MRRGSGAAFDQHANAEGFQFCSDFRNECDAGFFGSGLLEDTDDDGHAKLSQAVNLAPNIELWHKTRLSLGVL